MKFVATRLGYKALLLLTLLSFVGCGGGAPQSANSSPPPVVTPPPAAPTAKLSASPTTIAQGASGTLTWTTTNATAVSIDGLGSVAASGSQSVSPTATITYTLTATGSGGTVTATATVTVTTSAPPPPPPAAPTATFSASPASITQGASSTLTWSTTNATSVNIDALGSVPINGSQTVSPMNTTTYTLSATGAGGTTTVMTTITVTAAVPPPPPTCNPPDILVNGACAPPPSITQFTMHILPPLAGAAEAVAEAVNDSGVVVGYSAFEGGTFEVEATMWVNGMPIDLGVGIANAINSSGQVAGGGAPGPVAVSGTTSQGWFWSKSTGRILIGTLTDVGENTTASGIDDNGTVVGQGFSTSGISKRGLTWSMANGIQAVPSMVNIFGIHVLSMNGSSGSSVMAGTDVNGRAVLVTIVSGQPVTTDLGAPMNVTSAAQAVNQLDDAVGLFDTDQSQIEAFNWNQLQTFVPLGTNGTRYSSLVAVNDFNQAVGIMGDSAATMAKLKSRLLSRPRTLDNFDRAVVWSAASGIQDLNTLGDYGNLTAAVANGINNKGEIVGTAFDQSQVNQAFILEPQ
jgi:probable HAF family extracellular repeat protein